MDNQYISAPCGAICQECNHHLVDCRGCYASHGVPWWITFTDLDNCEMYECCILSGHLKHCGQCNMFPCDLYDEGDPVNTIEENKTIKMQRIEQIKARKVLDELEENN